MRPPAKALGLTARMFGACCLFAACSGEQAATPQAPSHSNPAPASTAEVRVVDMAQLAAAVRQNLGRGALVNVWATW